LNKTVNTVGCCDEQPCFKGEAMAEQLIQSQLVEITGRESDIQRVLNLLRFWEKEWRVTIHVHSPSVPSPSTGVDTEVPKFSQRDLELEQYRALMELACADIIFFHSQESAFTHSEPYEHPEKVAFSVLVNDLFVPAADAEGFDISEAIPLRDVFRKDGFEGVVRWVQQKRDGMPLRPKAEKRISEAEAKRSVPACNGTVDAGVTKKSRKGETA